MLIGMLATVILYLLIPNGKQYQVGSLRVKLCKTVAIVILSILQASCGKENEPEISNASLSESNQSGTLKIAPASISKPETGKFSQVSRGQKLYQQYCANCHGVNAEGAPNWHQRGTDGTFPAPPLNGSGHAWHHPKKALLYVIKNGSPGGQGNMPAWKAKLDDQQIDDIIAWFQSRWPKEIVARWISMDRKSRNKKSSDKLK